MIHFHPALRRAFAALFAIAAVAALVPTYAEGQTLEQAYKREFAFLAAEKNALSARVAEVEANGEERIAAAQAEIDALQGQILATSVQAERLNETLMDAERNAEAASDNADVLGSILTQAAATLEKGGIRLPAVQDERAAQMEQLKFAFQRSLPLLSEFSSLRRGPGTFFDNSGKRVDGTIVQFGQVAAYGVHDDVAGILAPAGGDLLKIWPEADASGLARAILDGKAPPVISLFLFESLDKGVDQKQEKTPLMVIESGGIIGWVIVWIGVVALLMMLARVILLATSAARTESLLAKLTPLLQNGQVAQAIELCRSAKTAAGRVLETTLGSLHKEREALQDAISEAILKETPRIDRFGSAILVVAAVSPLLGLLGTVTGMIATFDIITEFGTGNPQLLSSGISVALVTTELGLIVAIPALMFGNLLNGWGTSIKTDLDKAALRVSNLAHGVHVDSDLDDVDEAPILAGALPTP